MIGKWVTITEACERFQVTRRTIERWRAKYTIRAARLSRRHPVMLHVDDLSQAERHANKSNPALHDVASTW